MAYDEGLAQRVREALAHRPDLTEKKMFGGLCFLLGSNMCCGVTSEDLMLRVGADAYGSTLALPHAREMNVTGRAMKGMVYVGDEGTTDDRALRAWLDIAVAFAGNLPPK